MKLATTFRLIATTSLTLIICSVGCNTRTPIGEVTDGGDNGPDAGIGAVGDGPAGHGTGGVIATGGNKGSGGVQGAGGVLGTTGEGGAHAPGGRTGEPGGRTGAAGGTAGSGVAGTAGESGGASGTAICQSYSPPAPTGAGGYLGTPCYQLTYPASGFYGDNILASDCSSFESNVDYELAVDFTDSITVQVTLTALSISGVFTGQGGTPGISVMDPGWYIGTDGDWRTKAFDTNTRQQIFQTRPLQNNQTDIKFQGTGTARVDIYDCDLNTPSRSKIISWGP